MHGNASLVPRVQATIFALALLVSLLQYCHHQIAKERAKASLVLLANFNVLSNNWW